MERIYQIFGKKIKVNTLDDRGSKILHQELALYPICESDNYDLPINYVSEIDVSGYVSNNPARNYLLSDGMIFKLGAATIKYYFDSNQISQIDFSIDHKSSLRKTVKKWKSMQFTSNQEAIGQIFHELILVPLALIEKSYSVVHSSGIINNQNEVVLFGGTGGVGKTSLEMALCLEHDCSFFNDDIAVMDSGGNCFPNFSYPKIYGYNLVGTNQLKKEVLNDLSFVNRMQYRYRALKGKNKVRRRVDPIKFYGKTFNTSKKISSFVILFRSKVDKIKLEIISAEKASNFNSMIMSSEYDHFYNHLSWHEFNSLTMGRKPFITYDTMIDKITKNFERSLRNTQKIFLAHIPLHISNADYKVQMVEVLKNKGLI